MSELLGKETQDIIRALKYMSDNNIPVLTIGGATLTEVRQIFTATAGQTIFILSGTPLVNTDEVRVNGQDQYPGSGHDYVLVDNVITFNYALNLNDEVMVTYNI